MIVGFNQITLTGGGMQVISGWTIQRREALTDTNSTYTYDVKVTLLCPEHMTEETMNFLIYHQYDQGQLVLLREVLTYAAAEYEEAHEHHNQPNN